MITRFGPFGTDLRPGAVRPRRCRGIFDSASPQQGRSIRKYESPRALPRSTTKENPVHLPGCPCGPILHCVKSNRHVSLVRTQIFAVRTPRHCHHPAKCHPYRQGQWLLWYTPTCESGKYCITVAFQSATTIIAQGSTRFRGRRCALALIITTDSDNAL